MFLCLLAALLGVLTYSVARSRHRLVRSDADLVSLLPVDPGATTFYIDVALLRSSHILGLIAPEKTAEPDYQAFVNNTGFDYARDLDAVSGSLATARSDFLLRGRFDWTRLQQYARKEGGHCENGICVAPGTTPGRWAAFKLLQPDVLALSVDTDRTLFTATKSKLTDVPADPVWVKIPGAKLNSAADLPLPAQLMFGVLAPANNVLFEVGLHGKGLRLQMRAHFNQPQTAEATRNQLELETKMLNLELTREHQQPSPGDLTGALTAGSFQLIGSDVVADWPLSRELLESLEVD